MAPAHVQVTPVASLVTCRSSDRSRLSSRSHGPTVLRVCRAVVGAIDADDAWSETFLSAMRAYPSLPDEANVEAWLVTIAHRRAIDVGRARSRRAVPTDTITDHADRIDRTQTDLDLAGALALIPDKQRRWRITTWPASHTPRSPRSWVGPSKPHDAPPPTGSPRLRRSPTLATLRNEPR